MGSLHDSDQPRHLVIWTLARWGLTLVLILGALVLLNHMMFATMATVAPPSNAYHRVWAYEAYLYLGYAAALLAAAAFVGLNLRLSFPYLTSSWSIALLLVVFLGMAAPRYFHALQVGDCYNRGGTWDAAYYQCRP